jgi:hypothetical protein
VDLEQRPAKQWGGIPPITDITPLEYSARADFPVRSARTVLVDSPA